MNPPVGCVLGLGVSDACTAKLSSTMTAMFWLDLMIKQRHHEVEVTFLRMGVPEISACANNFLLIGSSLPVSHSPLRSAVTCRQVWRAVVPLSHLYLER
ncbi:hypothetical protein BC832DRAFT_543767 [Gaertneriomyces semiglobifer]|nr:hypothetical protein BC832DRAFT_543767 [Gaertneriomyces semiglobifer]